MHREWNREEDHCIPGELTTDTQPITKRADENEQALPGIGVCVSSGPVGSSLIHHSAEIVCLCLVPSFSNALPGARLAVGAYLRVSIFEGLAVFGEFALSLGAQWLIGRWQKSCQGVRKQVLIAETGGTKQIGFLGLDGLET